MPHEERAAQRHVSACVIGAGVMGAAIAAHFANAGASVLLLDRVPDEEKKGVRNLLAEKAVAGLKERSPSPIVHENALEKIRCGNIDDDLERACRECDWIVEAVIENIAVKRDLYARIEKYRGENAIVSSNTSTIPLSDLVEGRDAAFKKHFCITHFFNPPRYMRLLEIVGGVDTDPVVLKRVEAIGDETLGKEIVPCKDTPGFIANRIGCYWITAGVVEAARRGVSVTDADAILSKPFGVPSTGVFGLADLIGVDLIPLIAASFRDTLPKDDPFLTLYKNIPDFVEKMIAEGYTGRKGKGGFYRLNKEGGKKTKEARHLPTGEYAPEKPTGFASVDAAKKDLAALMRHDDAGGRYARAVMLPTFVYAAELAADIANSVRDVDRAMRFGYNWKYGPFELMDRIGARALVGLLEKENFSVPGIVRRAAEKDGFYRTERGRPFYIDVKGESYASIETPPEKRMVADYKQNASPVLKNASAALWDIGDGVACLEFRSKMNSVDPFILDMYEESIERVKSEFSGLLIANDGDNFCVGANLGVLLFAANTAGWKEIDDIIRRGQNAYMGFKYAPFPVVAAPTGFAFGGGCELLLHCDAVQAHMELYAGLVEIGVGVVPGWGGCKEMLWSRLATDKKNPDEKQGALSRLAGAIGQGAQSFNAVGAVKTVFETIAMAKTSESAEKARDLGFISKTDGVTMNRARLLNDAKHTCLRLADGYAPPSREKEIRLPGKTASAALKMGVAALVKKGVASEYDALIADKLARVLTGGDVGFNQPLSEQDILDLEREAFMELIKNEKTLDRIEHMLETGKPLRN
ncbi:MAG: 3-hydroxyacyl-CoA dehydrogenase NAD-binding domain-containing protein [Rickettsiales bacterium]